MSEKIVSEQDIDEILKEIGYNDSPLRRSLKRRNERFKIKHNEQFWRDLDA